MKKSTVSPGNTVQRKTEMSAGCPAGSAEPARTERNRPPTSFRSSPVLPQAANPSVSASAGLLTRSSLCAFPAAGPVADCKLLARFPKSKRRNSQQRVLSQIRTAFPFDSGSGDPVGNLCRGKDNNKIEIGMRSAEKKPSGAPDGLRCGFILRHRAPRRAGAALLRRATRARRSGPRRRTRRVWRFRRAAVGANADSRF